MKYLAAIAALIALVSGAMGDAIPDPNSSSGLRWISPWEMRDSLRGVPLPVYLDSLENFERFIFGETWRAVRFNYESPEFPISVDTIGLVGNRLALDLAVHINFDEYDVIDYLLFETEPGYFRLIDRRQYLTSFTGPIRHRLTEIDDQKCIEWWEVFDDLELMRFELWICDTLRGQIEAVGAKSKVTEFARASIPNSREYDVAFGGIRYFDQDSLLFYLSVDSTFIPDEGCMPAFHSVGRVRVRLGIQDGHLIPREATFLRSE